MSYESKKVTTQILDLFSELDWGSQKHGYHTVTNEKSKKRRKHKEYTPSLRITRFRVTRFPLARKSELVSSDSTNVVFEIIPRLARKKTHY